MDTNVLVSAFLGRTRQTPPQRIVEAGLLGAFRPVCCDEIALEFRNVALRPKLVARHRQSRAEIDVFLTRWVQRAMHRSAPTGNRPAPDPDDQMLWNLLSADPELILVTGDQPLLDSGDCPGRVMLPADFQQSVLR